MRTFVAVACNANEAFARFGQRLRALEGRVKPVAPPNAHVTLKFLGQVEERLVPQVVDAVREGVAAAGVARFEAPLLGAGAFPKESAPRVVWVGVAPPGDEALTRLAAAVEDALAARGYPREKRAFHPHATVARVESLRDREGARAALEAFRREPMGTLDGSAVKVMKSTLGATGPAYASVGDVVL